MNEISHGFLTEIFRMFLMIYMNITVLKSNKVAQVICTRYQEVQFSTLISLSSHPAICGARFIVSIVFLRKRYACFSYLFPTPTTVYQ